MRISKIEVDRVDRTLEGMLATLRDRFSDVLADEGASSVRKHSSLKGVLADFRDDVLALVPDEPVVKSTAPLLPPPSLAPVPKPAPPKPSAPVEKLQTAVASILKADPKLTAEMAVTKALEANPDAYDAIEREREAREFVTGDRCWTEDDLRNSRSR